MGGGPYIFIHFSIAHIWGGPPKSFKKLILYIQSLSQNIKDVDHNIKDVGQNIKGFGPNPQNQA